MPADKKKQPHENAFAIAHGRSMKDVRNLRVQEPSMEGDRHPELS
jgi:hypothetical protein